MANTSATGGVITAPQENINGITFDRFMHDLFVDLTGLPNELVRQGWEQSPAVTPEIDVNWMAYGISERRADFSAYLGDNTDGLETKFIRHEEVDINLIFYGDDCLEIAQDVSDGFLISQNNENLFIAGLGYATMSSILSTAELIKNKFYDRCDATLTLRREIRRNYPILSFLSASGIVYANKEETTETQNFNVIE